MRVDKVDMRGKIDLLFLWIRCYIIAGRVLCMGWEGLVKLLRTIKL